MDAVGGWFRGNPWRLALLVALGLWRAAGACAGEEPEHRFLVYALALGAGFSPEDSRTLADASWSQDTNRSTVAFSGVNDIRTTAAEAAALTRDPARIRELMQNDEAIDYEFTDPDGAFRRIASTAFVHSIVDDPRRLRGANPQRESDGKFHPEDAYIRGNLDAAYHRFLRGQQSALRDAGEEEARVHAAGLLIAGQYIHQFIDAYAHPEDAVVGHAGQGHLPDQAWADPERFKTAAFWTLRELKLLRGTLETTDERGALFRLSGDADQKAFANDMVDAIVKGYDPSLLRKTPLGSIMAFLPSELSEKDEQRFTREIGKALNSSALRRHPTFEIPVPGYTRVEYELTEDGRMRLSYGRLDGALELDDFVQWVYADPQFDDLWQALRANVRAYIRDYPLRASQRLEELRKALQDLEGRLQGTKQSIENFGKGRAEVDRTQRARDLAIPARDLNQERVAARNAAEKKAARDRAEAAEEAEAAKRRQERIDARGERESGGAPGGGIDHGQVRQRICRGVGVLCD